LSTGLKGGLLGAALPSGVAATYTLPPPGQIPTPGIAQTEMGTPTPPPSTLPMLQVTPQLVSPPPPAPPFFPPR
jgi:hypothetical protein